MVPPVNAVGMAGAAATLLELSKSGELLAVIDVFPAEPRVICSSSTVPRSPVPSAPLTDTLSLFTAETPEEKLARFTSQMSFQVSALKLDGGAWSC